MSSFRFLQLGWTKGQNAAIVWRDGKQKLQTSNTKTASARRCFREKLFQVTLILLVRLITLVLASAQEVIVSDDMISRSMWSGAQPELVQQAAAKWDVAFSLTRGRLLFDCPHSSFNIFLARTKVEAVEAMSMNYYQFCKWLPKADRKGNVTNRCIIEMTPYSNFYVSLRQTGIQHSYSEKICKISHDYFKPKWIPLYAIAGVTIFLCAPILSRNSLFRSASVVFMFAAVAHVFLLIMLYRTATSPGAVWKFFMLSLLPILGTYFLGSYWPLFARLDAKSIATIYAIFFGICGMTISFYYEESLSNPNVGKMLCLFLYITGLFFVYYAIQSEIAMGIAISILIISALLWHTGLLQFLRRSIASAVTAEKNTQDEIEAPLTPVLPSSPGIAPRDANMTRSPIKSEAACESKEVTPQITPKRSFVFMSPSYLSKHGGVGEQNLSVDELSPLVKYEGKILNLSTGRKVHITGETYHKYLKKGFTPDFVNGVLSPPKFDDVDDETTTRHFKPAPS